MGTTQSQESDVVATEDTSGMIPFNDLIETTAREVKILMHYPDRITSCVILLAPASPDQNTPALMQLIMELQLLSTTPSCSLLKVQILPNRGFGHLSMEVDTLQPVGIDMELFHSRMDTLKKAIYRGPLMTKINAALLVFRVKLRIEDEFEVISSLVVLFLKCGVFLSADKTDTSAAHMRARVILDKFGEVYSLL